MEQKETQIYGYIYITTNLVNGIKYIGQKTSSVFVNSYIGSGLLQWRWINKYGYHREQHLVEIIEWCYSEEELNNKEKNWIKYYDAVNSKNYYNISAGGKGRIQYGWHHSQKTKSKMSLLRKQKWLENPITDELRLKYSESHKGLTANNKGLPMDIQQKKKISNTLKLYFLNIDHQKLQDNHADFSGKNNPCYNKTPVWKDNIRKYVNNDDLINYLNNGWTKGVVKPGGVDNKGNKNPCYGKKLMNNGIIQKYILLSDVAEWEEDGWILGKLKRNVI